MQTVHLIEEAGGTAFAFGADVSKEVDIVALIGAAVEQFGSLDVIFNNAGIPTPRPGAKLEDHTVEDFDRLTGVNLRGVFFGCKHAVIQFKKEGAGGVILKHGIGRRPRLLGRDRLRRDERRVEHGFVSRDEGALASERRYRVDLVEEHDVLGEPQGMRAALFRGTARLAKAGRVDGCATWEQSDVHCSFLCGGLRRAQRGWARRATG
jgi:hypothetical protein